MVDAVDLVVAGEQAEEWLAVGRANFAEASAVFDYGWRQGLLDGLEEVALGEGIEEGDVQGCSHFGVPALVREPAVVAENPEASAEFESEHPAVNDGTEDLIV